MNCGSEVVDRSFVIFFIKCSLALFVPKCRLFFINIYRWFSYGSPFGWCARGFALVLDLIYCTCGPCTALRERPWVFVRRLPDRYTEGESKATTARILHITISFFRPTQPNKRQSPCHYRKISYNIIQLEILFIMYNHDKFVKKL